MKGKNMVCLNNQHINISVPNGTYGGAMCMCPKCSKKRGEGKLKMTKDKPEKYIVWIDYGYEGWRYCEVNSLEEALNIETYGNKKRITKDVFYEINEVKNDK